MLARARSQNTATADPDVDRNTVTGLKSTKNEPAAQHTPQSKPVRLDCLTLRYVRSEDQPRNRHPRLCTPCCGSRSSSAGSVGRRAGSRRMRGCERRAVRWRCRLCCRPFALVEGSRKPTYLPFPSAQGGHHGWPVLCAFSCAGAVVVCARGWSRAVDLMSRMRDARPPRGRVAALSEALSLTFRATLVQTDSRRPLIAP